jgi:ribosome recycling factor
MLVRKDLFSAVVARGRARLFQANPRNVSSRQHHASMALTNTKLRAASSLQQVVRTTTNSFITSDLLASVEVVQLQQRLKHSARKGAQREALEEMAHKPEREAAQERRQKKKNRKESKKKKGGAIAASETPEDNDHGDDGLDDFVSDIESDAEDEENEDVLPSLPEPSEVKAKMMKTVDKFQESLKSIRGAEPTPELFDDIQVNAYGDMVGLKNVAQVVISSPTLAQVSCFDPSTANEVAKSITLALDLNPQVEEDGNIRVPLPRISMETRQQTAIQLKKKAESYKRKLRQVRRKAMDVVKKAKDGKLEGISQDEAFARGKELDAVTESVMSTLQALVDKKLESIMKT